MFMRVLLAVVLLIPAAQLVLAHDLWVEKQDGKLVLLYGHGTKHDPYDPQKVKEARAVDSKGTSVPVEILREKESASLSSTAKPAMVAAFFDGGYWLKTTEGWKNISKREAQGKFSIVEALKSRKYAKVLLDQCEAFSKPVGLAFEIVPEKDPLSVKPGQALPLRVLLDGKPLEGAVIKTSDAGHSSSDGLKTDKDGKANVMISKPGPQLINASYKSPLKDDPDADNLSLSSSLTFETK